jgi:hypothetical protein
MTTILLACLLLVLGSGTALVRAIRLDGLGHRPPPRSHLDWDAGLRHRLP